MTKIKCIIFDWGGVLIDNPVDDFTKECANLLCTDANSLTSAYAQFAYQFERGLITEKILWHEIGKLLNIKILSKRSIWYKCFKKIYSPRTDMFALANQLKKKGYLIALLSNTEAPAMNFFNDQNYEMFDSKVFSCQEGVAKPESELYEILLAKINIPARHTLFIDDKTENIETARKLGMNVIHYTDIGPVKENMAKLNILY